LQQCFRGFFSVIGFTDKAVAFALNGLYKTRVFGIVTQNRSNLANRGVDTMLSINEDVLAPKPIDDFLPADDVAISFREQDEQLERNTFNLQNSSITAQLKARAVKLEFAEIVRRH
jgi:hypothetical protein